MRLQIARALVENVSKALPPEKVYRLAEPISYAFLRGKQKRLRGDVARLFPEKDGAWVDDVVRRQRIHRAWVAIDKAIFPRLPAEEIVSRTDPASVEAARAVCDEALAEGNGAIIYTMHFGRPTLSPIVLGSLGYPYVALRGGAAVQTEMDRGMVDHVQQRGVEVVDASDLGSGVHALRALKRNKLFFVLVDGHATQRLTSVEFCGQRVPISLGFAQLARRTGAALIAGVTYSTAPLGFRMSPRRVRLPEGDLEPEALGRLLLRPLEEMVLEDVGQWYGINRMFRKARLNGA